MAENFKDNTLYKMDNLEAFCGINRNSIDLIATDPLFNTKRKGENTCLENR